MYKITRLPAQQYIINMMSFCAARVFPSRGPLKPSSSVCVPVISSFPITCL